MTPQEKNVFGKLFAKTELATQKIDLSSIKILEEDDLRMKKGLDKLKNEFLSFASHDLKSPIALIKQFASLIERKIPAP